MHQRCSGVRIVRRQRSVTRRNVEPRYFSRVAIPGQGKVLTGAPPTRGINLMDRIGATSGFGRVSVKPTAVQPIFVVFICAGEKPFTVPDLRPGVVSIFIRPTG